MTTLVGIARGGPRDGVKLMCPHYWHGRVELPEKEYGTVRHYPGWYGWDEDFQAWIWHEDKARTPGL